MSESPSCELTVATDLKTIMATPIGTEIEVQGSVGYTWNHSEPETCSIVGAIQLVLRDGLAEIRVANPEMTYAGGDFDYITGKHIEFGDDISVRVTVVDNIELKLDAGTSDITLTRAGAKRFNRFMRLRDDVHGWLVSMISCITVSKNYPQARKIFANLRTWELTADERAEFSTYAELLPHTERPMYLKDVQYAKEVHDAYGVNPEEMNFEQFMMFADAVYGGIFEPVDGQGHQLSTVLVYVQSPLFEHRQDEMHRLVGNYLTAHATLSP